TAPADPDKTNRLAGDFAHLDAIEFITDSAKPEELSKFGLEKPNATATVTFNDGSPAKSVQFGVGREGKPEVYVKLADAAPIFTIRANVRDEIQSSLAFRTPQLWQFAPGDVTALDVTRGTESYKLSKSGPAWSLSGPFDGRASALT